MERLAVRGLDADRAARAAIGSILLVQGLDAHVEPHIHASLARRAVQLLQQLVAPAQVPGCAEHRLCVDTDPHLLDPVLGRPLHHLAARHPPHSTTRFRFGRREGERGGGWGHFDAEQLDRHQRRVRLQVDAVRALADVRLALEHGHVVVGRERPRRREARDASAADDNVEPRLGRRRHACGLLRSEARRWGRGDAAARARSRGFYFELLPNWSWCDGVRFHASRLDVLYSTVQLRNGEITDVLGGLNGPVDFYEHSVVACLRLGDRSRCAHRPDTASREEWRVSHATSFPQLTVSPPLLRPQGRTLRTTPAYDGGERQFGCCPVCSVG